MKSKIEAWIMDWFQDKNIPLTVNQLSPSETDNQPFVTPLNKIKTNYNYNPLF